ncbi:hypothetical protein A8H39_01680 [Paraburkholderia fungorum]|uniref:hypothetical protein n=1 Tax=Paraburkholderia fungorum TaxID=134537 RepID=UPI000487C32C|nr:hypothetical protein [Paraburkholderia fungorum]PNE59882.1 hypothetical protein A8H39_01680 [Paraburkholderia fungorum]
MNRGILLTSVQVARKLLPISDEWTRALVAAALEEVTRWYFGEYDDVKSVVIDRMSVVKEMLEMSIPTGSRDRIVAEIEVLNFECEWIGSRFETKVAGFKLTLH